MAKDTAAVMKGYGHAAFDTVPDYRNRIYSFLTDKN